MGKTLVQDPEWGEISRETGYGHVKDLKAEQGKRNAQVVVNAEHLKDPVQGWVDTELDRDMFLAAQQAKKTGQRVWYRIDVHRKRNVDTGIPFADLERGDKVRDVRELTPVDGDGTPLEPGKSTEPSLPLDTPAKEPDPQPQPQPEPKADEPPAPAASPPEQRGGRRARIEEARPWEPYNSDGSLNLGSYAIQASQAMVLHAHDLIRTRDTDLEREPPTETQIGAVAARLLKAADVAQASVRADGHADRNDNSHARAREAVKAAVTVYPVPFAAWKDEVDRWEKNITEYATMILSAAVKLVDREVP